MSTPAYAAIDYWTDDGKSGSVVLTGNAHAARCAILAELRTDAVSFSLRGLSIAEASGDAGISLGEWMRNRRAERTAS